MEHDEKLKFLVQTARGVQSQMPPRENQRINISLESVHASGPLGNVHVVLRGASNYKQTGLLQAYAAHHLTIGKPALGTPDDHPAVLACQLALRECGLSDRTSSAPFATDAGPLSAHGIPSVVLGPGDIAGAGQNHVGLSAPAGAGPIPHAQPFGAVHHRLIHAQVLEGRLLAGDDDVDVVAAAQAMVRDRQ